MADETAPAPPASTELLRSLQPPPWLIASSMTLLLLILISTVFIVPVTFTPDYSGRALRDISFTLILLSGAIAIYQRQSVFLIAVFLCLVAIACRWSEFFVPVDWQTAVREGASLLALALIMTIVAMRVFAAGVVTVDRIMGAVVLYLLLGIAWAVAYELVATHDPGAFSPGDRAGIGPQRWFYFSFVTLTTVGYGDITPVARVAQSLATLEALVGQLYPAIVLARLVSLRPS
jgi:Ion channel